MRNIEFKSALKLAALLALTGCTTTARYVTAEHWTKGDTFYVGFTEYKETNLIITSTGKSSAHVMLCNASDGNDVTCRPQVAVDRLLNPDLKFDDPPPAPPPPPPAVEAEPVAEASEEMPNS